MYNYVGGNMATNLNIDQDLLVKAFKIGKFRTKKDTVNYALEEFIRQRKQKEILKFIGKIDFDENYDYKKGRRRN